MLRHIFSHVPTSLTNCLQSTNSEHCTAHCSYSNHVTAPYKLSFYYHHHIITYLLTVIWCAMSRQCICIGVHWALRSPLGVRSRRCDLHAVGRSRRTCRADVPASRRRDQDCSVFGEFILSADRVVRPHGCPHRLTRFVLFDKTCVLLFVLLSVPRCRLEFGSRAFRISAPKIWNSLHANIRDPPSLPTFRRHLKTHHFQLALLSPWWSPPFPVRPDSLETTAPYKFITYLLTDLLTIITFTTD